jgi:uridine kinase
VTKICGINKIEEIPGALMEILARINELLISKETVIVAIEGNSGAGKSTLAFELAGYYDCNIFHMDDFFLTDELRTKERLSEVGGNIDYLRFREEIIDGLLSGQSFSYRPYNCRRKVLEEPVCVFPKRLNIIEGSYSMHPTLVQYYDLSIFLYIDYEEQVRRILERNGPAMLKRFKEEWIPMENSFFEVMGIMEKCDIIIYG